MIPIWQRVFCFWLLSAVFCGLSSRCCVGGCLLRKMSPLANIVPRPHTLLTSISFAIITQFCIERSPSESERSCGSRDSFPPSFNVSSAPFCGGLQASESRWPSRVCCVESSLTVLCQSSIFGWLQSSSGPTERPCCRVTPCPSRS